MGTRGPIPKRPEQRRRRNQTDEVPVVEVESSFTGSAFVEPNPQWSKKVMQLWDAALESAHTLYYEPSDWAQLYAVLDDYNAGGGKPSAGVLKEVYAALGDLLFSEGARRRASVITTRDNTDQFEESSVAEIQKYMEAFTLLPGGADRAANE